MNIFKIGNLVLIKAGRSQASCLLHSKKLTITEIYHPNTHNMWIKVNHPDSYNGLWVDEVELVNTFEDAYEFI